MELQLTDKERFLISELRKLVKDILEDEYEETDEFLITWLQYTNNDVRKAEHALRNNKKWRRENKMDKILLEEMKEMHENYPVDLSGFDKEGCPIMGIKLDGDIRKVVDVSNDGRSLYVRYMMKHCEQTSQIIRSQYFHSGGKVRHFNALVDMDGFCFRQIMSRKVVLALTEVARTAEQNYPGLTKNLYVVNAPKAFSFLLNIMKPFLSANTLSRLKLFDGNKAKWRAALLEDIPEDQMPVFLH